MNARGQITVEERGIDNQQGGVPSVTTTYGYWAASGRLHTVNGVNQLGYDALWTRENDVGTGGSGKGDQYTIGWFHHESGEAIRLAESRHLSGDAYVAAQQDARLGTFQSQGNTSFDIYHPSLCSSVL